MDENFKFPELFMADLLKSQARGKFAEKSDNPKIFMRALVVAVDNEGGKLQNPGAAGNLSQTINGQKIQINATDGPKNPRGSIKARILSDGFDQFYDDDSLKIYYPFFSEHMSVPIKPGEHVLVLFEDSGFENGWWIGKVPGHEGLNYSQGEKNFDKDTSSRLKGLFGAPGSNEEKLETDEAASEAPRGGKLTKLFR